MENSLIFKGLTDKKIRTLKEEIATPSYVIDEERLCSNGEILKKLSEETGCKVLLAQKAFSNYDFYEDLSQYMAGTEASGLYEARLGYEEMPGKEVHVFCSAYSEAEFNELLKYADHIVFNSPNQLRLFGKKAKEAGKQIGLRINPECSTQDGHDIYDPCAAGSRLGVTRKVWDECMDTELIELLDGIHFHTLCEQGADDLETTLVAVEEKFGDILPMMKWLNMGGGHHITKEGYDIELLKKCINKVAEKWNVSVYLEPGEAWALNAGYLFTKVLDIVKNGDTSVAILDSSAACHTPDVIEMPYLPPLYEAWTEEKPDAFKYRLAGPTCLAGDIFGDYYFEKELSTGDVLIFGDMAIYSMCKNNTFNGMKLPDIVSVTTDGSCQVIAQFGYEEFYRRLGSRETSL